MPVDDPRPPPELADRLAAGPSGANAIAEPDDEGVKPSGVYAYSYQGERLRVVVASDVVALPDENWSAGGFGDGISEHWLLNGGHGGPDWWFPGKTRNRKRLLAYLVRRSLAAHHGYTLSLDAWPFSPEPEPWASR